MGRSPFPGPLAVSLVLHLLGGTFLWYSLSKESPAPRVKSIRVDIVSPPPNVAGEPPARAPAEAETAPEPEPEAAAPEPAPEAPAEPAPAPRPVPRDPVAAPTPPRRAPAKREADKPARRAQETAREAAPRTSETKSARTPTPATGRTPDPKSPGGEGLRIRSPGAECASPAYCNNIARQVQRYFRRPAEARSDRADVCFRILRNGSVDDIDVQRLRGSLVFKLALMEAVERAGQQRAFGALPGEFGQSFSVCVAMEPESS